MNTTVPRVQLGECAAQPETSPRPFQEREERYELGDVEGRLGASEVGTVINISRGGLALETSKYLQVGKSYPITVKRPKWTLRLTSIVVWSQLIRTVRVGSGEVRPIYRAGFRFSKLSSKQRRNLEILVSAEAALANDSEGPRAGGS